MSNSIGVIGAGSGLQHSQKTDQLAVVGKSAQGAIPSHTTLGLINDLPGTPAVKPAADVKNSEAVKSSAEHLQQSLVDINKVLDSFSISVQFKIDPDYKELIVKVVDQDTGKLIRQIPTEEVVKMSKAMDNLKGLLFAQTV